MVLETPTYRTWLAKDVSFEVRPVCAPEGIRTPNLLIRSQMLYPLSYGRLLRVNPTCFL